MFEAVHGSAPDIAGKDVANPSGLLVAATQMLVHLGLPEAAQSIKNALLCTLEDGIHTADIFRPGLSTRSASTRTFTQAVIERLGCDPQELEAVHYSGEGIHFEISPTPPSVKELVGVDVFLDWSEAGRDPEVLGRRLEPVGAGGLRLKMISNRGIRVYPGPQPDTLYTDHWRCRFVSEAGPIEFPAVLSLLEQIHAAGLEVIKTEHLYEFDGQRGYSLGQGE